MIYELSIEKKEPVIMLGKDLVYRQVPFWSNASYRSLTISLLRERSYFDFDPPAKKQPVIVFLCGGGWVEMDPDVWMPELTYFAKNGYAVAAVQYSVSGQSKFPTQIIEIRQAIRFLRAHAEKLRIDPDRIAIMGESAGGHLASVTALSADRTEFDSEEYAGYSSGVNCAVIYYGGVDMIDRENRGDPYSYKNNPPFVSRGSIANHELLLREKDPWDHQELFKTLDPRTYLTENAPPFMLLYGTKDIRVPVYHGDILHEALSNAGIPVEYLRIEGGRHASAEFFQSETKKRVLDFLNAHLNPLNE